MADRVAVTADCAVCEASHFFLLPFLLSQLIGAGRRLQTFLELHGVFRPRQRPMRTEARSLTDDSMTLDCRFCLNLRASIERNVEMSIAIATAVIDAKRLRQVYALRQGVCFKKKSTPRCRSSEFAVGNFSRSNYCRKMVSIGCKEAGRPAIAHRGAAQVEYRAGAFAIIFGARASQFVIDGCG